LAGLALRELRRLARALQTGLLPLLRARIAREQPRLAQDPAMLGVDLEERPRDGVPDRAELPGFATAVHLHHRVEATGGVRDDERLDRRLGIAVASEVLLERLAVDHDGPLARD